MKHIYNFSNMGGRKCQVVTSTKLTPELLAKYKKVLGIACTHTVDPLGNDIARPVVVEYDGKGLSESDAQCLTLANAENVRVIGKKTAENAALKARIAELEESVDASIDYLGVYCHLAPGVSEMIDALYSCKESKSDQRLMIHEAAALREGES